MATPAGELRAEIAAVRAATNQVGPWHGAVERSLEGVLRSAQNWPMPPPFDDDSALENALEELNVALDNLASKSRGEDVPEPALPAPPPSVVETASQRAFGEHQALLEVASRYQRVRDLPYDLALASRLFEAADFSSTIPPVPSLWPYGLDTTASLIAAVGRNSSDAEFDELVEECSNRL